MNGTDFELAVPFMLYYYYFMLIFAHGHRRA